MREFGYERSDAYDSLPPESLAYESRRWIRSAEQGPPLHENTYYEFQEIPRR